MAQALELKSKQRRETVRKSQENKGWEALYSPSSGGALASWRNPFQQRGTETAGTRSTGYRWRGWWVPSFEKEFYSCVSVFIYQAAHPSNHPSIAHLRSTYSVTPAMPGPGTGVRWCTQHGLPTEGWRPRGRRSQYATSSNAPWGQAEGEGGVRGSNADTGSVRDSLHHRSKARLPEPVVGGCCEDAMS